MNVEPDRIVINYKLVLSVDEANDLYSDITVVLRKLDVDIVSKRGTLGIKSLYALYDALNDAGACQ